MKSPKLASEAQKVLDGKDSSKAFRSRYGTHYVLAEERGASLSVVLALDEFETETKTEIVGSLDASGGAGPLSASVKAKLSQKLASKFKESKVTLGIHATGGDGFCKLGELVHHGLAAGAEIKDLLESLKKALEHYEHKWACPVGYFVGSLSHFGYDPGNGTPLTEELETRLFEAIRVYRACRERRALTRRLLTEDDPRGWAFAKQFGAQIETRQKELREVEREYQNLSRKAIDAYEALLKGDLSAEPPQMNNVDRRFKTILCPVITLRVDDVKSGARLDRAESWAAVSKTTWDNVQSYILVEGMGVRNARVLYKDETRLEESGVEALATEIPPAGTVLYTAVVIGNEFALWNKNVSPFRRHPLGGSTRDRGKGEFRIVVEDLFGNVTEKAIATVEWTNTAIERVTFLKSSPLFSCTLSLPPGLVSSIEEVHDGSRSRL
jgi:hypothetical protein